MRLRFVLLAALLLSSALFVGARVQDTTAHGPPSSFSPHWHAMSSCPPRPNWVPSNGNCYYPRMYWCDTVSEPGYTKGWFWVDWYAWHGGYLGSTARWIYLWNGCYW